MRIRMSEPIDLMRPVWAKLTGRRELTRSLWMLLAEWRWLFRGMDEVRIGIEKIYQAKEILLSNLENPPSLMELARQVALNDFKLKRGFRQVVGTSAFKYLHDYRLEKARQLLVSGEMNVEEVAFKVGFDSRSYFALAFRKKFGLNPKQYFQHCQKSL